MSVYFIAVTFGYYTLVKIFKMTYEGHSILITVKNISVKRTALTSLLKRKRNISK